MEYFIGYLPEGEIVEYYKKITSDLSDKFGILNLQNHIPLHLTLKIPFDAENIKDVEEYIKNYVKNIDIINLKIDEFEKFDGKRMTISLKVDAGKNLDKIEKIIRDIDHCDKNDIGKSSRTVTLHMSIARFLSKEQCDEIWSYLHQDMLMPNFNICLNNLTIFKKINENWFVHRIFYFKK